MRTRADRGYLQEGYFDVRNDEAPREAVVGFLNGYVAGAVGRDFTCAGGNELEVGGTAGAAPVDLRYRDGGCINEELATGYRICDVKPCS